MQSSNKDLKCQFHSHCQGDPCDNISYSAKQLIDKAHELNYDVLAITCHRKLIFNKDLEKYARKKGILLIPAVEFEINQKHILGINIDREIEKVSTFEKLKNYRKSHPHCLIIAPHPFFPGKNSLKNDLVENIALFDAIEISFAYTRSKNYNLKGIQLAKHYQKPLITTADCHILNFLNIGYCLVQSPKNPQSIITAIKNNKIQNITKPTSYLKIARFFLQLTFQNLKKGKI